MDENRNIMVPVYMLRDALNSSEMCIRDRYKLEID